MENKKSVSCTAVESLLVVALLSILSVFVWNELGQSWVIPTVATGLALIIIFSWLRQNDIKDVADRCFRYRWLLALMIFLLCVLFRIHGSSIGTYDEMFPTQIKAEETTLFGKPRWIRSDEYGVQTPTFFSQYYNNYQFYSDRKGISETNMVLDYYSPVRDITGIGKPLMWGYLLFGNEIGLSWYWCGMQILFFMLAFEMSMILTKGEKTVSVIGSMLIALAPEVQWWMQPHMPIVILNAMGIFCIGYYFFTAKTIFKKWLYSLLAIVFVTGFALSIFPSFQVPCVYIILILLAACVWRDRENITFCRREWVRIAFPFAVVAGIIVYFLLVSKNDIELLMNTVYPGRRVCTGGNWSIRNLFTDISTLFLPYRDIQYSNNCEVSGYVQFAPFFLALFPRFFIYFKNRNKRDWMIGMAFAGILAVEIIYMLVGIPTFLASITLLRYCNRMNSIYDWTATLYTIWGFAMLLRYPDILSRSKKIVYPLIYGILYVILINEDQFDYFSTFINKDNITYGVYLIAISILVFVLILLLVEFQRRRLLVSTVLMLMLFAGATVNPIERGVGAIYNHPISAKITEIATEYPDARWLSLDTNHCQGNFLVANGAKSLDATDFYPDVEKWSVIDPSGQYENIYNRYANYNASLIDGEFAVDLMHPDCIKIQLNPEIIKKLEVKYLLSTVDYSDLLTKYGIACEYVDGQDNFGIYRLSY